MTKKFFPILFLIAWVAPAWGQIINLPRDVRDRTITAPKINTSGQGANKVLATDGSGNASWVAETHGPTVTLAASNARSKVGAKYVGTGTNDESMFSAAVTDLGSNGGTVTLSDGTFHIDADLTLPSNGKIHLVANPGTRIAVSTGITLTLPAHNLDHGPNQLFTYADATSEVVFSTPPTRAYPQWFGAVGDGTTDDAAAFQRLLDACPAATGADPVGRPDSASGTLFIPDTGQNYVIGTTLTLDPGKSFEIAGNGSPFASRLQSNGTPGTVILVKAGGTGFHTTYIHDLSIDGWDGSAGIQVEDHNILSHRIVDNYFYKCTKGVEFLGQSSVSFDIGRNFFSYNQHAIDVAFTNIDMVNIHDNSFVRGTGNYHVHSIGLTVYITNNDFETIKSDQTNATFLWVEGSNHVINFNRFGNDTTTDVTGTWTTPKYAVVFGPMDTGTSTTTIQHLTFIGNIFSGVSPAGTPSNTSAYRAIQLNAPLNGAIMVADKVVSDRYAGNIIGYGFPLNSEGYLRHRDNQMVAWEVVDSLTVPFCQDVECGGFRVDPQMTFNPQAADPNRPLVELLGNTDLDSAGWVTTNGTTTDALSAAVNGEPTYTFEKTGTGNTLLNYGSTYLVPMQGAGPYTFTLRGRAGSGTVSNRVRIGIFNVGTGKWASPLKTYYLKSTEWITMSALAPNVPAGATLRPFVYAGNGSTTDTAATGIVQLWGPSLTFGSVPPVYLGQALDATLRSGNTSTRAMTVGGATVTPPTNVAGALAVTNAAAANQFRVNTASGAARTEVLGVQGLRVSNADPAGASTTKTGYVTVPPYAGTGLDTAALVGSSASGSDVLNIGGGSGAWNAFNQVNFYTAGSQGTVTGTLRERVWPTGGVTIGSSMSDGSPGAGGLRTEGNIWDNGLTASTPLFADAAKKITSGSYASPLSMNGSGVVSIPAAASGTAGYLTAADWAAFAAKENPLTFTSPLSRSTNTVSLGTVPVANGGTGATSFSPNRLIGSDTLSPTGPFREIQLGTNLSFSGGILNASASATDADAVHMTGPGQNTMGQTLNVHDVIPASAGTYSLGSSSNPFGSVWAGSYTTNGGVFLLENVNLATIGVTSPINIGTSGGNPINIFTGSGSPNGVIAARVGSLYIRVDGGAGSTLYVKETGTGNTGWAAK